MACRRLSVPRVTAALLGGALAVAGLGLAGASTATPTGRPSVVMMDAFATLGAAVRFTQHGGQACALLPDPPTRQFGIRGVDAAWPDHVRSLGVDRPLERWVADSRRRLRLLVRLPPSPVLVPALGQGARPVERPRYRAAWRDLDRASSTANTPSARRVMTAHGTAGHHEPSESGLVSTQIMARAVATAATTTVTPLAIRTISSMTDSDGSTG